jgi:hypothetical protein
MLRSVPNEISCGLIVDDLDARWADITNAWEGNRTPTPLAGLRILSPVRLPVPPPRPN